MPRSTKQQRVKLRHVDFEAKARTLGIRSRREQADAIGVHESIHSRMFRGERELSGPYVIGVLMLIGDDHIRAQIRSVFEVADDIAQAS